MPLFFLLVVPNALRHGEILNIIFAFGGSGTLSEESIKKTLYRCTADRPDRGFFGKPRVKVRRRVVSEISRIGRTYITSSEGQVRELSMDVFI